MATTLNNSGIVFPDSTTQTTAVPSGYREIYSGVVNAAGWYYTHNYTANNSSVNIYQLGFWWTLKYGSNQTNRQMYSSDSFLFHTTVNDYYYTAANGSGLEYNMYTSYKAIAIGRAPSETRLSYMIERNDFYPYPNNMNVKIFASTATDITSATFGGNINLATQLPGRIANASKWARPY